MRNILVFLVLCFLFANCFNKQNINKHSIKDKNRCFINNIKAKFSLGDYTLSYEEDLDEFNELYVDSALYYNNLAFNECSKSKRILETRLYIFDLKQNYSKCIEIISDLIKLDSVDHSERLDLSFKKFTYYACIDSVKYKGSMKKEYAYLLNQPKEWNDSLYYQFRLGLLEYQLFGKKEAMKRLNQFRDSDDFFVEATVLNIEGGSLQPLFVLVGEAGIYHPLNDNRVKAHMGN
ncbi:MAG: hypothetical protein LBQ34_03490 [Alphaproteobacteria bacterium]|jgi:hypothetical protein|nr:hypothetical protein [Alphaproteobacteria bacterium]